MTGDISFETYGQVEKLISSIRNIIKDYNPESIFKEFLQNADDAGATRFHVIVDYRSHPTNSLFCDGMKDWQGPAILIFNDAKFRESDFESLMQIRVGGKQGDDTKIGKHGLGFNSCYHFTDVPSFISGDFIAFLDPQEKFLPRDKNDETQRGIKGPFPQNGIDSFSNRDQLVPFQGIEGINFQSTFEGTLFRIPLRQQPSDISDSIFTAAQICQLIENIKLNFSSQFLFLRNVEKIEMSYIPEASPFNIISLWKAAIIELDQGVKDKRKFVADGVIQTFQIKVELSYNSNEQIDRWVITTGAQQNPEDAQLRKYAGQYRLRVLGGVAALLKSSSVENENNFMGRMFCFFSLPDTTGLPVHLNGTWAQGSDRGRLLIEHDNLPDLDHQKLNWNRHILLNFLPKVYSKLLEEVIELHESGGIDLQKPPILKFWPFPLANKSYPKYVIDFGFKVLLHLLESETIFRLINNGAPTEKDRVDFLLKHFEREQLLEIRNLLCNNWNIIGLKSDPRFKSMVRLFPIWPILSNPLEPNSSPPLKSAASGHILNCRHYKTNETKIFLDAYDRYGDRIDRKILTYLNVKVRDTYSYIVEDVEFPEKYDDFYIHFIKSTLDYSSSSNRILQGLKSKACFPSFSKKLKKIDELYDHNNIVFRTVFGENNDVFLHHDFLQYADSLSNIGFRNKIDQSTFIECAEKIVQLQSEANPPSDIRYRGFTLVDYFYKHIDTFQLEDIKTIPFVPTVKKLDKPYSLNLGYNPSQSLNCFNDIIQHSYKEVAWTQLPLITEDVIPPSNILQRDQGLGKPNAETVVNHLRFMYGTCRNNDEWKRDWAETFKNIIFKIYKWLDEECHYEDLNLAEYFRGEPLFLNYNHDQDPFNANNWVSATNLVLKSEPNEEKYVNPKLATYSIMLKSAGVREVTCPNVEINVREHDQSNINRSTAFNFLLDDLDQSPFHDITFIVNGERIRASRYMLAASSRFFYQEFVSGRFGAMITIDNVEPNSMRILLRYLYCQNIDDAIPSLIGDGDTYRFALYKDLLKLANDFRLDHLKELMELRLSRLVTRLNVDDVKRFAETTNANQLKNFVFILLALIVDCKKDFEHCYISYGIDTI